MQKGFSDFFLVREEILPEAIKKTIKVKAMLKRGEANTINEAVAMMDLSRSAYYKYKDHIFPFYEASQDKPATIGILLEHKAGALSGLLALISEAEGNIVTINQGVPLHGAAEVTITVDTTSLSIPLDELLEKLRAADGVKSLEVLGQA